MDTKKILLQFMSNSVLFSSRSFIVSSLTNGSSIHFEFIFVDVISRCSNLILWYVAIQPFIEKIVFCPLCIFFSFFIDYLTTVVGLVSAFLPVLLIEVSIFCASTILFWWLYLCSIVWNQGTLFPQVCLSFSILLCLFWVYYVPIQIFRRTHVNSLNVW